MKSIHPFEAFLPKKPTKLIIGTIPPSRFCKKPYKLYKGDVNFYYGSKDNYFWSILEDVFETKLEYTNSDTAIEQRKTLLEKHNIGIADMVDKCIHKNDSAIDKNLAEIECKDIKSLLIENPSIKTLIYTSMYVKRLVNMHFKTYHTINPNDKRTQEISINNKTYQVKILYSPSPFALRNMGNNAITKHKDQYRHFLTEH